MAVLVAVLAGVSAYGVPRIVREASAGAAGASPCPPAVARTVRPDRSDLESFLAPLADGRFQTDGEQVPSSVWVDRLPSANAEPARGFQIVWWAHAGDHMSGSVFAFSDQNGARAFLEAAGSTSCRGPAVAFAVSRPGGGRVVVSANQYLMIEAEVLFVRGRSVFRITDVPRGKRGRKPSDLDVRRFAQTAERVACRLPAAGCG
jgi:hypothetical protein